MDPFYDLSVGHAGGVLPVSSHSNSSLGQEYLLSDSGALSPMGTASGHGTGSGTGTFSFSSAPARFYILMLDGGRSLDRPWLPTLSAKAKVRVT
jgi:hypothetical protein